MARQNNANRFNVNSIPFHTHNGVDSPAINQSNIQPGIRASGSITFAQSTDYHLGLTFNPTSILFYGAAIYNPGGITIRAQCIGNAQLGPSFYFQPNDSTSVVPGQNLQNIIQSSSMMLVDSTNPDVPVVRVIVDEGHLVDVEYSGIMARATVVAFDSNGVTIRVHVEPDWSIIGNYVVT